jgi:hypothetical protein
LAGDKFGRGQDRQIAKTAEASFPGLKKPPTGKRVLLAFGKKKRTTPPTWDMICRRHDLSATKLNWRHD